MAAAGPEDIVELVVNGPHADAATCGPEVTAATSPAEGGEADLWVEDVSDLVDSIVGGGPQQCKTKSPWARPMPVVVVHWKWDGTPVKETAVRKQAPSTLESGRVQGSQDSTAVAIPSQTPRARVARAKGATALQQRGFFFSCTGFARHA